MVKNGALRQTPLPRGVLSFMKMPLGLTGRLGNLLLVSVTTWSLGTSRKFSGEGMRREFVVERGVHRGLSMNPDINTAHSAKALVSFASGRDGLGS